MSKRSLAQILATILCAVCASGCPRTVVHPENKMQDSGLSRPRQIVVYDFAVTAAEVTEEPLKKMLHEVEGTPKSDQ